MRPDKFKVLLGDYDTMVDVAFSEGEGETRVRFAVRLHAAQAQALAMSLQEAASQVFRKQGGDVLIDTIDVEWKRQ